MLLFGLLIACGCGRHPPFEMVAVTGRILSRDEKPLNCPRLEVVFIPDANESHTGGLGPRPARALVNVANGRFGDLTTWSAGDGVVAGKHKVLVIARDKHGQPHPAVSSKYGSPRTTPLSVEVIDGAAPLLLLVETDQERAR